MVQVSRFADGEVSVMVHENVRGKDVFVIQPTCYPVNENMMELLLMVRLFRSTIMSPTLHIVFFLTHHGAGEHYAQSVGAKDHRRDPLLRLRTSRSQNASTNSYLGC